ncbi:hypothetical protein EDC18_101515 [Natranaerovirga pectinivora]|uniref:Methyltransferase family protein n=1 Tax=Natranaerovirga pectinivora TaxID=682400 RepID=A0A4R3MPI6_9FIRM|nr:SAM-dependent methyltransferase [Natranaerovirga pectinivora]TCT17217.1 hypothetical protein EDC18_101515 [Natranaerovirga pectinivora]
MKEVFNNIDLPFNANTFDIISNRHESFDAGEVRRILKDGGYFITQQVGSRNNNDLSKKLLDNFQPQCPEYNLKHQKELLINEGFNIVFENEVLTQTFFYDLGALVYLAKIIEWEFPGFSVDTCFDKLCDLQTDLIEKGYISAIQHRFIIVAQKV